MLLFRFSALTFNGHRIHYDREYCTEVEGYPGLVVHGPLMVVLLLDLLRHERPHVWLESFDYRVLSPAFDGAPLAVLEHAERTAAARRRCGSPVSTAAP